MQLKNFEKGHMVCEIDAARMVKTFLANTLSDVQPTKVKGMKDIYV